MAARTVRCLLSNQTASAFSLFDDSYSSGQFTDPFFPPPVMAPGAIAEWRSGSCGFMRGAAGGVRYSTGVPDSTGGHTESINITWDNPFIGPNRAKIDVIVDFTGKSSTTLRSAWFIQSGKPPPNLMKMAQGDWRHGSTPSRSCHTLSPTGTAPRSMTPTLSATEYFRKTAPSAADEHWHPPESIKIGEIRQSNRFLRRTSRGTGALANSIYCRCAMS
jgi:hypothetical protein